MPISLVFFVNGKKLKNERVRDRVRQALKLTALESVQLLKIEPLVPKFTTVLVGSFFATEVKDTGDIMTVTVGSPFIHGIVQNDGRRIGKRQPPPKAMEQWVLRKGIFQQAMEQDIAKRQSSNAARIAKGKKARALPKGFTPSKFRGKGRGSFSRNLRSARGNPNTRAAASRALSVMKSVTFLISRSIKRDGIPGKRFYEKVQSDIQPAFRQRIADAIAG